MPETRNLKPETAARQGLFEQGLTNALAKLVSIRDELAATSNKYASRLLYIPLWHHQRTWDVEFRVTTVFKGQAATNITVRIGLPYQTGRSEFRNGQSYILFLQQRHADVNTPELFTLKGMQCALPFADKYQWEDQWTTLEIGKPFKPLDVRNEEHHDLRTFTHEQFLRRIQELVRKQTEDNRITDHCK